MEPPQSQSAPNGWLVIGAFAIVYFVWGAVYLVIAFAIETLPPLLMMGIRLVIAGPILYFWTIGRGAPWPTLTQWRDAAIVGGLIMSIGVGVGAWSQQWVPSGLTGVITGTAVLWMVLIDWWWGGPRPGGRTAPGLIMGLAGIAVIAGPDAILGTSEPIRLIATGVLLVTIFSWAAGSMYAVRADLPDNLLQATGMEMIAGGGMLVLGGTLIGEWSRFSLGGVSLVSALAWAYLIVLAGVVAFSAYFWLLRVSTSARVATFAYVHPVIALFLGWALRDEELTPRTLAAAGIIVGGVALIATQRAAPDAVPTEPESASAQA